MAKRKKAASLSMTETEWRACTDPVMMVEFARRFPRATDRVWRLFLSAYWKWLTDRPDLSDRRGTPDDQIVEVRRRIALAGEWAETGREPDGVTDYDRQSNVILDPNAARGAADTARSGNSWAAHGEHGPRGMQPVFLRDLFGPHPFRRVTADRNWFTSTVLALATGIYEERAFDRLPILADAFQDAECDNDEILNHCRDPNVIHIRGCWVLDLVLQKT